MDSISELIIFALAGYTIGRTLLQEDFAPYWVARFVGWTRAQENEAKGIMVLGNEVLQVTEVEDDEGEIIQEMVLLQENTLRLPHNQNKILQFIAKPFAILLAKIGELFDCVFCLSAQSALQLAFWTLGPWAFLPIWASIALAAPAITYLINDYLNGENDKLAAEAKGT